MKTRTLLLALAVVGCTIGQSLPVAAAPVLLDTALDHATLPANVRQKAYLRVGLSGLGTGGPSRRAALNVALVIDRSGSMAGKKIEQAKQAALAALAQLQSDDILSVVAYNQAVSVIVPATKVSNREVIIAAIRRLHAAGTTALFAGTVKGAEEVRKFLDPRRVNRVVLLSDGLANVGPSTPESLGSLGQSLRREGISVTTVGLGLDYNEDLMFALARASGGSFAFVENASDLARLYQWGFGSMASIVAKDVTVRINLANGFRPVRSLGYTADVIGQTVTLQLAQLYSGTTEQIVIEIETPALPECSYPVGNVQVRYHDLSNERNEQVQQDLLARFSARPTDIEASVNPVVMVAVAERMATERSQMAMQLRDQGRVEEAQRQIELNDSYLRTMNDKFRSEKLQKLQVENKTDGAELNSARWNARRKSMQQRRMDLEIQGF